MKNSKNQGPVVEIVTLANGRKMQITTSKMWVKANSNGEALKDQKGEYLQPTALLLAQHLWNDYTSAFVDTPGFKAMEATEQEKAKKWIKATQERGTSFNLVQVEKVDSIFL